MSDQTSEPVASNDVELNLPEAAAGNVQASNGPVTANSNIGSSVGAPIEIDCKDYLKDTPAPNGQLFGVFAFVSPRSVKDKTTDTMCGIKFIGAFATETDARAWIEKIKDIEPHIHLFIGDVGKWLPFDPDPDNRAQVGDSQYRNDRLNNLMKLNVENHQKANVDFWERKQEEVNKVLQDQKSRRQKQKERARRKLMERQNIQRMAGLPVSEAKSGKNMPKVKPANTTEPVAPVTNEVANTPQNAEVPENVSSEKITALAAEIKQARAELTKETKEADAIRRDALKLERIYNRLKAKQS
jgi:hypothetical protein